LGSGNREVPFRPLKSKGGLLAPEALEKLEKIIKDATDLAVQFMDAADIFIDAVLNAHGWKLH